MDILPSYAIKLTIIREMIVKRKDEKKLNCMTP